MVVHDLEEVHVLDQLEELRLVDLRGHVLDVELGQRDQQLGDVPVVEEVAAARLVVLNVVDDQAEHLAEAVVHLALLLVVLDHPDEVQPLALAEGLVVLVNEQHLLLQQVQLLRAHLPLVREHLEHDVELKPLRERDAQLADEGRQPHGQVEQDPVVEELQHKRAGAQQDQLAADQVADKHQVELLSLDEGDVHEVVAQLGDHVDQLAGDHAVRADVCRFGREAEHQRDHQLQEVVENRVRA